MAGHDNITPEGKKFFAEIEKLRQQEVRVGFQQGEASADGVDIADIAMWNELGTSNMPSRPFMRQSVDDNSGKISSFCRTQVAGLAKGKTAGEVYQAIGVMQKGLVQEKIKSGSFEPNAPATIKKKGSDKPLIDSGKMRQSVNYVVQKKDG